MSSLFLEITLRSDASFPESPASLGGGRTRTFIPGSALMGAVAAHGRYLELRSRGLATQIFHDGAVRFGQGLPCGTDGAPCLPMPRCLHAVKGKENAAATDAHNLARAGRTVDRQLQPLEGAWFDRQGNRVRVPTTYSLRTATDGTGRPREGFLYGIEHLRAGTRFLSRIDAADESLLEPVREALLTGVVHLGRSKGAELGECTVKEVPGWSWPVKRAEEVVILCASEVALIDRETGLPTLDPAVLTGAGWDVNWDRSFVRNRRLCTYNAHRRTWNRDRHVLEAGSVVVVRRTGAQDVEQLALRLARGVGEGLAEGLGQVVVDWAVLEGPTVRVGGTVEAGVVATTPDGEPDDELFRWMKNQETRRGTNRACEEAARKLAQELSRRKTRLSASQWRDLAHLCRKHAPDDRALFVAALREHTTHANRKLETQWGRFVEPLVPPDDTGGGGARKVRLSAAIEAWVQHAPEGGSGFPRVAVLGLAAERVAERKAAGEKGAEDEDEERRHVRG